VLDLSFNRLESLHGAGVRQLTALEGLYLEANLIPAVPSELGALKRLRELVLSTRAYSLTISSNAVSILLTMSSTFLMVSQYFIACRYP
jgi:Leucine-rich repeat (LRR) protein